MAESTVLYGAGKVRNDLIRLGERLRGMEFGAAMEAEVAILEQGERDLFGMYHGKYQDTGALMASLTQTEANGAIRRWHGPVLEFGTSIWYGRFQTRIGEPSGKPRGRKRPLPVKVLQITPAMRRSAVELVRRYMYEGL